MSLCGNSSASLAAVARMTDMGRPGAFSFLEGTHVGGPAATACHLTESAKAMTRWLSKPTT